MNRDAWFQRMPGSMFIAQEKAVLDRILKTLRIHCLLQIGGPIDNQLTDNACTPRVYFLDHYYRARHSKLIIQGKVDQLPIDSESMDVVFISHACEFSKNYQGMLQEAHRVLKPTGKIIVSGFNRWSMWQLWKLVADKKKFPWCGHFYSAGKIKRLLCALDFEIDMQQTACFRPPLQDAVFAKKMLFLETLGQIILPGCGGVFFVVATKNDFAVTPLHLNNWMREMPIVTNDAVEPATRSSV